MVLRGLFSLFTPEKHSRAKFGYSVGISNCFWPPEGEWQGSMTQKGLTLLCPYLLTKNMGEPNLVILVVFLVALGS